MSELRWDPPSEVTTREAYLLKRLQRTKKLFRFLREHRLDLFDEAFQGELATMYRDDGVGKEPVPPAQLAMAVLLQAYTGSSDAEAIENTVVDARWRMVLGILGPGEEEPPFSQGTLQRFRQRLIAHDMDRRLLERTVELAKQTRGFDYKKLPKDVRLAVDSRPLTGAGRVEDTFNLLGHAARKLLTCAAAIAQIDPSELVEAIDAPALVASSIKRGLDIDWNDPEQKAGAIQKLVAQIDRLEAWVRDEIGEAAERPPLSEQLATLAQLREQDLEPDPDGGGSRIRDGVAPDRRISVQDPDMRHGRKSKSQTIKGYKTHLAADIDSNLIVACAVTPANKPEADALPAMLEDLARYRERNTIGSLHIDRGYVASEAVRTLASEGVPILSKPWRSPTSERFTKSDFKLDLRRRTITCPAGETEKIQLDSVVHFQAETCDACPMRARCTEAAPGRGRAVTIAPDELLQKKLRRAISTASGRAALRDRVVIEHRLAHHARKQGPRARYVGVRNNLFDNRRHAATINLESLQLAEAA
ncbi:MAG: IS1182 family transposase [Sandaracinaceae bacterium]|nr:IS1182 family transposase [Sandaracinaceae bacterium]